MRINIPFLILPLLAMCQAAWAGTSPLAFPILPNAADTAEARGLAKPILESRILDDMQQTNHWRHRGFGGMMQAAPGIKTERKCLRLVSPTKGEKPPGVVGRPFGESALRRNFDREDWSAFNRLSFYVKPHAPGFKVISLLVKLFNDGSTKVPDSYNREGLHFVVLKGDEWNRVVWEIPHLSRDKITAVELIYRLQGNEPGATNRVHFDFDLLELQRVNVDHFEGWQVSPGEIAYCHSGYLADYPKIALAGFDVAQEFSVYRVGAKRPFLTKKVKNTKLDSGEFHVLDFSEIKTPGIYELRAGGKTTRSFPIGRNVWDSSIIKTLNLFYCERCGCPIHGIHDICHQDWRTVHDGKTIVINGGWHDAGDLSQGLVNTSEAAFAMMTAAEAYQAKNEVLSRRLLQEAAWGLDWILKTRFGDGYRLSWATMDYWTDGVLGNVDDTLGDTRNSPYDNFMAAATEARAARLFLKKDKVLAQRSRQAAVEDWQFAVEKLGSPNLELAAAGAIASVELYKTTLDQRYADKAVELAAIIPDSQQKERMNWSLPLSGFFYTSPKRDRILHYAHRGHEQAPIEAMGELCKLFPNHPNWMSWYSTLALHSEYLKHVASLTAPYNMLPASVYSLDESNDPRFKEQVKNGIKLSDKHYLRCFPVWFDFRGNHGTVLSQTKALTAAGLLRKDTTLMQLGVRQLEWCVGLNPFCQSTMYGEGHNYAAQYTAMSGDMTGSLPVGIQTRENLDTPYWPAANCYNYKEVWVHPSSRWLSIVSDVVQIPPRSGNPLVIDFTATKRSDGVIVLEATVAGGRNVNLDLRVSNLITPNKMTQAVSGRTGKPVRVTWTAKTLDQQKPWIAVVIPNGKIADLKDVVELIPNNAHQSQESSRSFGMMQ